MAESENKKNILLTIKALYSSMTAAEKQVADYVLSDPSAARFLSIVDLAAAAGVGYTSVFRFCKTLSLSGYQEFKICLSTSIAEEQENNMEFLPATITMEDSVEVAAHKMLKSHVNAIMETKSLLDAEALKKACAFINDSDQVRFFGVGSSMLSAMEGMYKFLHIMPNVYCLMDTQMQLMGASTLNEHDVAIFISHSGNNKDILEMAQRAKSVHARTIGITRHANSPLTNYMDVVLICGGFESPLHAGSSRSKVAQLYMLDLLFEEVYRMRFDYSKKINMQVADSIMDKRN